MVHLLPSENVRPPAIVSASTRFDSSSTLTLYSADYTEQTELEVTIMPGSDMETIDTAHGAVLRDDDVVAFDLSPRATEVL
jgi:hypothetical protein